MHSEDELKKAITTAEKLHGHLGPFLVIGVRMGKTAQRILDCQNTSGYKKLQATVKTPMRTPFSCVIDGIQATTQCTIGNQRLRTENSKKEIIATFELQESDKALKVIVNQNIIEDLMNKTSESRTNEDLAWKIAQTPENQLFTIEKR